jgi:hypothetical protein
MLLPVPANAAIGVQLSTESSRSPLLEAIMGLQVRYFVCLAIGLSICGRLATGDEATKAVAGIDVGESHGGPDLKTLYVTCSSPLLSLRTQISGKTLYRPDK